LGHKVHPIGFRLGVIKDWQSKWYSETHYAEFILEDNKLREYIKAKYPEAAISLVEIDRQAKEVTITLHTARPGIVIGRGGSRVDEMRQNLEALIGKKIRLNIQEIRQPELDAYLVARSVAEQIERRVAYRRAMKQAIFRTLQSGAKGIKVSAAGRLANAEIARRQTLHEGQVPLHTLRADIDYGFTEAVTTMGRIGVKVWIYKGQVLPEKVAEVAEKPAEAAVEGVTEAAAAAEKPEAVVKAPVKAVEERPARQPKAMPPGSSAIGQKLAEAAAKAAEPKAEKAAKKAAKPAEEDKAAKPKAKKAVEPKEEVKAEKKAAEPKAEKPAVKKAVKPAAEKPAEEDKTAKPKAKKTAEPKEAEVKAEKKAAEPKAEKPAAKKAAKHKEED
jgi:small subunit ribosomal protein S3